MDIFIRRATGADCRLIADIGRVAVEDAHRNSCSKTDMDNFLDTHYSEEAILQELNDPANIYNVIFYGEQPAGFSKAVLNMSHPNIPHKNVVKLDRIYLLNNFYG